MWEGELTVGNSELGQEQKHAHYNARDRNDNQVIMWEYNCIVHYNGIGEGSYNLCGHSNDRTAWSDTPDKRIR